MTTRRFDIDYDARVGTSGGTNLGAGACDHLTWGDSGSYDYQSGFKLVHDWSGMTDGNCTVTAVRGYFRNSDENHLFRGGAGDRQFNLRPITNNWSAGSASHPMLGSNDVIYGDWTTNGTYETGPHGTSDVDNDWNDFDVAESLRYFAPTSITFPGGPGLGNTNRGFRIAPNTAASDKGEFWARNKGASYAIYFEVDYEVHGTVEVDATTNSGSVSGGTTYATPSVTVAGTATCEEGHAVSDWDFEIDDNSSFSSATAVYRSDATPMSQALDSAVGITRGQNNYIRFKATCSASKESDWSDTIVLYVYDADVPTVDGVNDQVLELSIEGTETNPRAHISWVFNDPNPLIQEEYRAIMYADDGVTVREDSGWTVSTATSHRFATYTGITRGTFYKFTVETKNSEGISAGVSSMRRLKAQWGLYTQYEDLTGTPTSWRNEMGSSEPANTRINVQHSSSGTSTPGTWRTALEDVSFAQFYHVRYWLFAWHGATTPTINSYTLHANLGAVTSADKWTLATGGSLSQARFVLGSRALRMACTTATTRISYSDEFDVKPNTQYILSGRAFSVGNSGGYYRVVDTSQTSILASTNVLTATTTTDDFEHLASDAFTTGASQTKVRVQAIVTGATGNECFFDCVQLEPGPVISPFRPGSIGLAHVSDMGGMQVDAFAGGTFRVRGSQGDANSVTELGVMGLEPGVISFREVTAPATPASGKVHVYAKSDGLIYRKDDAGTETALGGGGGMTFGSPVPTGTANADGSGTDAAREDHVHEHSWYEGSVWTWDADVTSSGALANVKTYNFFAATTINNLIMPRSGTIIALAVRVNAARTTGSLRFNVRNNTAGANLTLSATLDGTNTTNAYGWGAPGDAGNTFSAGDALSFRSEVTVATYAPITADVQIFAVFAFDD
jgi:hypothetical protein